MTVQSVAVFACAALAALCLFFVVAHPRHPRVSIAEVILGPIAVTGLAAAATGYFAGWSNGAAFVVGYAPCAAFAYYVGQRVRRAVRATWRAAGVPASADTVASGWCAGTVFGHGALAVPVACLTDSATLWLAPTLHAHLLPASHVCASLTVMLPANSNAHPAPVGVSAKAFPLLLDVHAVGAAQRKRIVLFLRDYQEARLLYDTAIAHGATVVGTRAA